MSDQATPRCPYSGAGLGAPALRGCPGFEPLSVSFDGIEVPGSYPGKTMPTGITCSHLGHTLSARGYRSECSHPLGLPTLWRAPAPAPELSPSPA